MRRYGERSYRFDVWVNAHRWLFALLNGLLFGLAMGITSAVLNSDPIQLLIAMGVCVPLSLLTNGLLSWGSKDRQRRVQGWKSDTSI
jgi:hypothetical protein